MDRVNTFKDAMANYPTGVTVVTAIDEAGNPIGLTVNSFASVSVDPLLILWSINKQSSTHDIFKQTDQFAVNILADSQADVATLFATPTSNQERFANCEWTFSKTKLPLITGSAAVFQCTSFKQIDAGDHTVLIGEVFELAAEQKSPLLYHGRKMGALPTSFHEK